MVLLLLLLLQALLLLLFTWIAQGVSGVAVEIERSGRRREAGHAMGTVGEGREDKSCRRAEKTQSDLTSPSSSCGLDPCLPVAGSLAWQRRQVSVSTSIPRAASEATTRMVKTVMTAVSYTHLTLPTSDLV